MARKSTLPAGFGAALKRRMRSGVPAGEAMRQTWREFKGRYAHRANPGAAWHAKEVAEDRASRARMEVRGRPTEAQYFRGRMDANRYAEEVSRQLGLNPDGRRVAGVYHCSTDGRYWVEYTDGTWAVIPKKHEGSFRALANQLGLPRAERACPRHFQEPSGFRLPETEGPNPRRAERWFAGFRRKGGRVLVARSPDQSWTWVSGPYGSKAEARASARAYQREIRRMEANPAKFCVERLKPPGLFDRRSFRTVVARKHRVTVGCPRGEWDNRAKRCRVPTVAQRILHPEGEKRCPVGGEELERRVRRNPWVVKVDPVGYLGKPKRRVFKRYEDAERYALAQPQHVGTAIHYRRPARRGSRRIPAAFMGGNPAKPVLIYDRLLELRAQKGRGSRYAGERFKHPFTSGAKVYGLPDGSVLLRGKKRLWDQVRQR